MVILTKSLVIWAINKEKLILTPIYVEQCNRIDQEKRKESLIYYKKPVWTTVVIYLLHQWLEVESVIEIITF